VAILTAIAHRRTLGFAASCLLHLGLIAGLLATERWLLFIDAVRPPVLLAEIVTASDAPPQPEIHSKPEPKRPLAAKLPRLLPAPLQRVAEAVTPPPAPKPSTPDPATVTSASPPSATSMTAATEPAMSSAAAGTPPSGPGTPSRAPSPEVASASGRETGAITQSARPQGGYQVRPSYPSSALREGKQGTTMLRVHVLIDGRVGDVIVQQSAGHPDLDQAAIDAVRRWRFDPARRGSEPVAMWVLLPVEFQIR